MGQEILDQKPIRLNRTEEGNAVPQEAGLVLPIDIGKMSLGRYIGYCCQVSGFTPEDVAERAGGVPLTARYITFLMKGLIPRIYRASDRRVIAKALGVDKEELEKRNPKESETKTPKESAISLSTSLKSFGNRLE